MSKPLYESVDEKVWMTLAAIVVLTIVVLSIIGAVNAGNNYVEPVNPLNDPYYYDPYEEYPPVEMMPGYDRYYGN